MIIKNTTPKLNRTFQIDLLERELILIKVALSDYKPCPNDKTIINEMISFIHGKLWFDEA